MKNVAYLKVNFFRLPLGPLGHHYIKENNNQGPEDKLKEEEKKGKIKVGP